MITLHNNKPFKPIIPYNHMVIQDEPTRAELIEVSIDDTAREIENIKIVIQELNNIKDKVKFEGSAELKNFIEKLENDVEYFEGIKENDEAVLRGLGK